MNICEAIRSRSVLEIYYDGGTRIIEPHCHGTSTAGNEVLRAFQVSGYSNSGRPHDWKLFVVSKIRNMNVRNQTFLENRPLYSPRDKNMSQICCHV